MRYRPVDADIEGSPHHLQRKMYLSEKYTMAAEVDMNAVDFMAELIEFDYQNDPSTPVAQILKKDGLKCENED